jgi:nucleotide-binding universal stress UspA family protein
MSGIIVGIDGSSHAQRALEWAMDEAALRNSPLTVITVLQVAIDHWGLAPVVYPYDETNRQKAEEQASQAVEKTAAELSGPIPPSVTVTALSGIPADVLIDRSKDADLLVVGTRGSGFPHTVLGSVSRKVAHHAACPVVIVR